MRMRAFWLSLLTTGMLTAAHPALGQDGDPAKPAPPAKPAADAKAPAAEKHKPPKDPSTSVAKSIHESLVDLFQGSGAGRIESRARLDEAVAEWSEDAKDSALRSVDWWRAALRESLPAENAKSGIREVKVSYLEGRTARLFVSIPAGYSSRNRYPLVVTFLPKDGDEKRALKTAYGEALKTWIVVAIPTDKKAAGFDVLREPWMTGVGLRHAVETYRVDRDRVVLDGLGDSADTVLSLGAEWAVHFAGVVLRAPEKPTDLASNLAMGRVCLVLPDSPEGKAAAVAEAVTKAVGEERTSTVAGDREAAAGVAPWLEKLPPRALTQPDTLSYSWSSRPQGGEVWSYWLWVFRASTAASKGKERANVSFTWTRDPAANAVHISSSHLAEGILLLNDAILDLDREVVVTVNEKEVFRGVVERSIETALYWVGQTGERSLWTPAEVRFAVPDDIQIPGAAKNNGGGKGGADNSGNGDGNGGNDGASTKPKPPTPPKEGDE